MRDVPSINIIVKRATGKNKIDEDVRKNFSIFLTVIQFTSVFRFKHKRA